ncbi:hypothetical protein CHUAL_007744 [Chamberlinius hualienensis]
MLSFNKLVANSSLFKPANAKIAERLCRMLSHVEQPAIVPDVIPTALYGREFEVKCSWGCLRGKEWGTPNTDFGIVGLHGLLDNCGTFDRIAPLLSPKYHFVCYDFPGYGRSTPYPPRGYQTKETYLVDYLRIIQHFGWKNVAILGHSLGGAAGMFVAAASFSTTNKIILLDPAKPLSIVDKRSPDYLANFASIIMQVEDYPVNQRPKTYEQAVKTVIEKSRFSLTEDSARIIIKRGTTPIDKNKDLLMFNTDAKNILGLQPMFGEESTKAFATFQGKNCDTLLITTPEWAIPDWAIGLDAVSREDYFKECAQYNRFTHVQVEGSHHVHLNNPERVSDFILEFLQNSKIDQSKPRKHPHQFIKY